VGPYNPASGMRPTRWPGDPPDFQPALVDYYKVGVAMCDNIERKIRCMSLCIEHTRKRS
jgi:hypothetical protein